MTNFVVLGPDGLWQSESTREGPVWVELRCDDGTVERWTRTTYERFDRDGKLVFSSSLKAEGETR